jgi:exopolyphosphatase/guanosine-5'-triphosphate,3'-diphosphate pyrophosphatase
MDDHHPEWGPFGVPLFDGPEARRSARVGVIDIGSNSVRMVVFDGAARSPAYFFNEKILCGLGAGFSETGRLNPEGRVRAMVALRRFAALAEGMGVSPLLTVATAAVRDAEDGPEFREDVLRNTGLEIQIIGGDEEARLSAQGVLLGWPGAEGLVCDIGGSSMELAELLGGGAVGLRRTSDLGPLKLMGLKGGKKAMRAHIKARVADLVRRLSRSPERLFLVGGSWRAIARIDMERRGYPLKVLHEYRMTPKAILDTIVMIEKSDIDELRAKHRHQRGADAPGAAGRRGAEGAGPAAQAPRRSRCPPTGIREGLLYEQMSRRCATATR